MMEQQETGIVLVDKPAGLTSFRMVKAVRRQTGVKKVGHAGTLDPFATGLLVIAIGRPATRLMENLMAGDKEYLATLQLGYRSTTLDPEGEISSTGSWEPLAVDVVEQALTKFSGSIMQKPPIFSALKHKGKPLYHYARQGIAIEKAERPVYIHQLEWLDRRALVTKDSAILQLRIRCSKGTYIRSLAADIGAELGCAAYLSALRRTRSGCFAVEEAIPGTHLLEEKSAELIRKGIRGLDDVRKLLHYSDEKDNVPCSSENFDNGQGATTR